MFTGSIFIFNVYNFTNHFYHNIFDRQNFYHFVIFRLQNLSISKNVTKINVFLHKFKINSSKFVN